MRSVTENGALRDLADPTPSGAPRELKLVPKHCDVPHDERQGGNRTALVRRGRVRRDRATARGRGCGAIRAVGAITCGAASPGMLYPSAQYQLGASVVGNDTSAPTSAISRRHTLDLIAVVGGYALRG